MRRLRHPGFALAGGAALLLSVAACGSEADGSAAGGTKSPAADDAGVAEVVAAAEARLKPYLSDPAEIHLEEPLPAAPESGKSVHYVVINVPTTQVMQDAFKKVSDVVGWKPTISLIDPSDPQAASAAVAQAVSAKADYIVVPSSTVEALGTSLQLAKDAGIPIIDEYSTDEVGYEENGIYANPGGADWVAAQYPALADWAIVDANGKANILYVGVPDIPILDFGGKATDKHVAEECPTCTYETLDATFADLGAGKVNSLVISALQQNPDINYIYTAFGDLATGLPEALKAAGLEDQAKIIVASVNPDQVATIPDGVISAALLNPQVYSQWIAMDAMLRLDQGLELEPDNHTMLPIAVADADNVPGEFPAGLWEGPSGFEDSFKELWKVE